MKQVDGTLNYDVNYCNAATMYGVTELSAALSWRKLFDNQKINKDQAVSWLKSLKMDAGIDYLQSHGNVISEMSIMCSLCNASVCMFINYVSHDQNALPAYTNFQKSARPSRRFAKNFERADMLASAIKDNNVNSEFLGCLESICDY